LKQRLLFKVHIWDCRQRFETCLLFGFH